MSAPSMRVRAVAALRSAANTRFWRSATPSRLKAMVDCRIPSSRTGSKAAASAAVRRTLIVLKDPQLYTLPVGVAFLAGAFSANWRLIAAGSVIAVLPIVVFFLLLQRQFIGGATSGAVKG